MSKTRAPYERARCGAAAYDAALHVNLYHPFGDHPTRIIAAIHDPDLGLERSVVLRDVVEYVRSRMPSLGPGGEDDKTMVINGVIRDVTNHFTQVSA